jgi:predicted nucleic acid-binding protein
MTTLFQLEGERLRVPLLVLDTNVVLDWLLFQDRSCECLQEAIFSGSWRWVASIAMRDELEHVLGRGVASLKGRHPAAVLEDWDRWTTLVQGGQPSPAAFRCTDPDDQKFIDLALETKASALLSRDRAVLKLARRARAAGCAIASARDWASILGHPQAVERC